MHAVNTHKLLPTDLKPCKIQTLSHVFHNHRTSYYALYHVMAFPVLVLLLLIICHLGRPKILFKAALNDACATCAFSVRFRKGGCGCSNFSWMLGANTVRKLRSNMGTCVVYDAYALSRRDELRHCWAVLAKNASNVSLFTVSEAML